MKRSVRIVIAVAAAGVFALSASGQNKGAASLWAVSDGEKIERDDLSSPLKRGNAVWDGKTIKLFGARNEVIAFQVIAEAGAKGIRRLSAALPELALKGGKAKIIYRPPEIDSSQYAGRPIQLFSVNYMNVARPTGASWYYRTPAAHPRDPVGWKPVQLTPENARAGRGGFPLAVAAHSNQAIWAEIYTARDLPAGVYTGRFEISIDGRRTAVPIELELFDFTLPDENSLTAMVYFESGQPELYHGRNLDAEYHRFARRQRVELVNAYSIESAKSAMGRFDGGDFTRAKGYEGPGEGVGNRIVPATFYGPGNDFDERESAWRKSDEWMAFIKQRLPRAITFLYMPDEPSRAQYPRIRKIADNIHSNPGPGRELPVFVTKHYVKELEGAIDIWDASALRFRIEEAEAERKRGRRYWIYNGGRPAFGSMLIDAPATDARVIPWACFKGGVEVYFQWHGVHWKHNSQKQGERRQNVWLDPITFDNRGQPNKPVNDQNFANGDGVLIYPGEEKLHPEEDRGIAGPISTFQLANLRRGLQDHLYLTMARNLGLESEIEDALRMTVPRVFIAAQEKAGFAEEGDAFEAARYKLAKAITGARSAQTGARVREAELVIPTYELGPPDPNPPLFDRSRTRGRPSYPYPLLDNLTNRRVDKSYRAVFLENEYLRVTVLPELGGKLYAIYDKTAGRETLYTNHVVKYAMVGIRGAWTSGGIEWNFPDGHTLTAVSPVDYVTRSEADGSATVIVGETERVQRMQWAVAIRLRPGTKVVETEVTLNNRRETPGRYWFWATAAAPATDDMRFIYPMREAYPHAFWPVFSFPKEKGVDLSLYREVTNALSLFARNSQRDFFGVYYEKSDWGVVHVADHRELPGKKTWTWGVDESGSIWIDKLTDSDGQYVEFQAGRFETQMEHEFIAPHRVERFTEYWFPVNKLGGGWDEATKDAALRVKIDGNQARVSLNANARFETAELICEANGVRIRNARFNLTPAEPMTTAFALPPAAVNQPLKFTLKDKAGRTLLSYRTDAPPDGNYEFKPATRPAPDPIAPASAEQAYVTGLAADKKSNEQAARAAYQEALKRDAGFAPAHIALGLSFYRTGEFDKSAERLESALRRNRDAGDAHYYLALTRRAQQREAEAVEHLQWCVRAGHREAVALYVLGEMALARDKTDEGLEHLTRSVRLDPRDLKARTALAMAERLAGKLEDAQKRIDEVVLEMPIDYFALHERYIILRERKQTADAERAWNGLWRLLSREPDALLELAFDYAAIRPAEARSLVERAFFEIVDRQKKQPHPMLLYFLNSSTSKMATASDKIDPAYIFPHRVEEISILQAALKANPNDGRAAYYLGNALASKLRFKEALEAWRIAVKFDPNNAVAHRNYARALALVEGNKEEAVLEFERSLELAPDDHHLYIEYDQLLAGMKRTETRIKALEGASEKARSRPALLQSLAAAYVDAGRYADAIQLLERRTFTSGEGEGTALSIYRRAHLALAALHRDSGHHEEAAAAFIKATEFPSNFGVGRESMRSQAREYVAAAREFEAAGKTDEAAKWWRRAADDALNSPTQPEEPWSEHYYYKAVALDHTGRKDEARALYERLARLADDRQMEAGEVDPPRGALRFLLAGWGLKALGHNNEARAAFQRALQLDPANPAAQAEMDRMSR